MILVPPLTRTTAHWVQRQESFLLPRGGLYMELRVRGRRRVGLLAEEWFTSTTPGLLDTKYQDRLLGVRYAA